MEISTAFRQEFTRTEDISVRPEGITSDFLHFKIDRRSNHRYRTKIPTMEHYRVTTYDSKVLNKRRYIAKDVDADWKRVPLSAKRFFTDDNFIASIERKTEKGNIHRSPSKHIKTTKQFTKFSIEEICRDKLDKTKKASQPGCFNRMVLQSNVSSVTGEFQSTASEINDILRETDKRSDCQSQSSSKDSLPVKRQSKGKFDPDNKNSDHQINQHRFNQHNSLENDPLNDNDHERTCKDSAGDIKSKDTAQHIRYHFKRKRRIDQDERRRIANERERSRVHTLAAAFDSLRDAIPSFSPSQKLSKLTILKVAINYISALHNLNSDKQTPLTKHDFAYSVDACTSALKAEYGRAKRISWQEKK